MKTILFAALVLASPSTRASAAPGCALAPGEHTVSLQVGADQRDALVIVGAKARGATPVVFAWHGFGGSPEQLVRAILPADFWSDAIVVFPRGLDRTFEQFGDLKKPGWQVRGKEHGDRDLAFFDALYKRLQGDHCLDERHVYSTGFSNGAFFSNVLACHRGDRLAAIAPVGGGGPFEPCTTRIPVRISHGTEDPIVPFGFAQKTAEIWSKLDGCKAPPAPAEGSCARASCEGGTDVVFCSAKAKHTWGGKGQAESVARFLRKHERGAARASAPSGKAAVAAPAR